MPGRRRLAALLLAAVIGISGGVAAALIGSAETPPKKEPSASESPDPTPPEGEDRLGLGVPRVDLPCDGKTYLLVGKGFGESALRPSLADWPQMKYANTRNSCDTAYPLVRGVEAKWVAYLPAFERAAEGCERRMSPEHKNDFLTRMQEGNIDSVPCPCEMQVSTLPVIGVDEELTTVSGMWIYQYQTMLSALYPELLSERNGYFDKATEDATYSLQSDFGLNPSGRVDAETWDVLRGRACRLFNW